MSKLDIEKIIDQLKEFGYKIRYKENGEYGSGYYDIKNDFMYPNEIHLKDKLDRLVDAEKYGLAKKLYDVDEWGYPLINGLKNIISNCNFSTRNISEINEETKLKDIVGNNYDDFIKVVECEYSLLINCETLSTFNDLISFLK